jgi:transposase
MMSRKQKHPVRALTKDEQKWLKRIARSIREPATHVARAKQLLAVANGHSYTEAAMISGRRSGDAVSRLVERFNREGVQAIEPHSGGGPKPKYGVRERERILAEARRSPDPERDGTATWSLMTLRRALRKAEDGLPAVSTYTIRAVLQEAGWKWPRTRTWCETGVAVRKRKSGEVVKVVDPDAVAKKT